MAASLSTLPPFPETAWRGIFGMYRDAIDGISECPLPFHFANLLALVAAEFGDRVKLSAGFLNFFIFVCGRTGTKKSTASDLVHDHVTVRLVNPQHVGLTSVSSAEGLIRSLAKQPNILLRYDEIKDLFASSGRSGSRMEPILNAAFDLRILQAIVKKKRESLEARDYYLCLVLNGTPDHVRLDLSEALFAGGLFNRFLVFASEPNDLALPEMGIPDAAVMTAVANEIERVTAAWTAFAPFRGDVVVRLSPDAAILHKVWYDALTREMKRMNDFEAKPLTRLDVYAKKVAGMYCLLEAAPTKHPTVTVDQMAAALDVMAYCRESMTWVTQGWSGPKTMQTQADALAERRVEAYVESNGCMSETVLYRALHLSAAEAARAINALVHLGVLGVASDRPRIVHGLAGCICATKGAA